MQLTAQTVCGGEYGRRPMIKSNYLEKELRKWRADRARKHAVRQVPNDRRTVRVNGQEVVVITKPKRAMA